MLTMTAIIAYTAGLATPWAWGKWGDTIKRKLLFWLPGPQ